MKKKDYESPKITRVKLEVKNAILAVCHSSPNMAPGPPDEEDPCWVTIGCYNPPANYL